MHYWTQPAHFTNKNSLMLKMKGAPAGMAQWIEHRPANQGIEGSIRSQGTCLGCGPGLQ